MYKTNLHSLGEEIAWNPEVVVDLVVWTNLRAQIESRIEQGLPPSGAAECGGDPLAYVACQDGYIVHILNPGVNPPNLAAAQGLSAGILRVGPGVSDSTELWVDDVRLAEPITTTGTAWALDARLAAGDVFDISFLMSNVNGQFRQLGDQPSFRTTSGLLAAGNFRIDRFLPASVGLLIPLNLTYTTSNVDPRAADRERHPGERLAWPAQAERQCRHRQHPPSPFGARRRSVDAHPRRPAGLHRCLHPGASADRTVADRDRQLQRGHRIQHCGDAPGTAHQPDRPGQQPPDVDAGERLWKQPQDRLVHPGPDERPVAERAQPRRNQLLLLRVAGGASDRCDRGAGAGAQLRVAECRRSHLAADRHAHVQRRHREHPRPPPVRRLDAAGTPGHRRATGPARDRRRCRARSRDRNEPAGRAADRVMVPPPVRHEQHLRAQPLPQQPPAGARRRRHGRGLHPAADLLQPAQLRVGLLDRLCAGYPAAGGRFIGRWQCHPSIPPA